MFTNLIETLSHLPVTQIMNEVAVCFSSSAQQCVPIIKAPVASGKTLLLPAACSDYLYTNFTAPSDDNVIVVLCPTRHLAMNAAKTMRHLLGVDRNYVGCLTSNRSDDKSIFHDDNRIIFTTVGYALVSNMLETYNNFIIDEAHETSIDLSITRALLQKRVREGSDIGLMIMSATMNDHTEVEFWGQDIAKVFTAESSAFPVEMIHDKHASISQSVLTLIEDHHRRGIVVFVSGKREITEAIMEIGLLLDEKKVDYEIYPLHGLSSAEEYDLALADPQHTVKILVSTNVIESGVNIDWFDGGVTSGKTKVAYSNDNVRYLVEEDLPKWRIDQQAGRVRRFGPGVFIISAATSYEGRKEIADPDITRLPLTEFVMHVASTSGVSIDDLKFPETETPNKFAVSEAIHTLEQYGLVEHDVNGVISLTRDGETTKYLPLSFKSSVAYCEAEDMDLRSEMIPLIAMMDMGDIRFRYNEPITGRYYETSDVVNATIAAITYLHRFKTSGGDEAYEFAKNSNLNIRKLNEYMNLVKDMERKIGIMSNFAFYINRDKPHQKDIFDKAVKRVLFRANLHEMYRAGLMSIYIGSNREAMFNRNSVVPHRYSDRKDMVSFTGTLRQATPKDGVPFTVLENITAFNEKDFDYLIRCFGEERLKSMMKTMEHTQAFDFYFSKKEGKSLSTDTQVDRFDDFEYNGQKLNDNNKPSVGAFGEVLKKALSK